MTRFLRPACAGFILGLAMTLCLPVLFAGDSPAPDRRDQAIFRAAASLGPGVNLGNALEAPRGADWGIVLDPGYMKVIKTAGFGHVRLPVRWSAYAATNAPFTLEPYILGRVDGLLAAAENAGLKVVLNVHHYDEMDASPREHVARWVAIWTQLATHYKGRSSFLFFELLNEPHDKLTDPVWNELFPQALAEVRALHPTRPVIIGPANWNGIGALKNLLLPESDRNLIATVHYYLPFPFTHQGAEWVKDSSRWMGRKWEGSEAELKTLRTDLDGVSAWGRDHGRPVYVGEFGSYQKADMDSRLRWTRAVARECEARSLPWAYWEFAAGFGIYDPTRREWRQPLLKALIPADRQP